MTMGWRCGLSQCLQRSQAGNQFCPGMPPLEGGSALFLAAARERDGAYVPFDLTDICGAPGADQGLGSGNPGDRISDLSLPFSK
jgi:hypothetical protein